MTFDDESDQINWIAVKNATENFYQLHPECHNEYWEWMIEENGIDHSVSYIRIVDKEKHTMFLLRWA